MSQPAGIARHRICSLRRQVKCPLMSAIDPLRTLSGSAKTVRCLDTLTARGADACDILRLSNDSTGRYGNQAVSSWRIEHARQMLVSVRFAWLALVLNFTLIGCDQGPNKPIYAAQTSDRSIEAGSHAFPTNAISADIFVASPEDRRLSLQNLLANGGKTCSRVLEAVFEQGMDGTDLWLARCEDTGLWLVTFGPSGTDFEKCVSEADCAPAVPSSDGVVGL